VYNTRVIRQRGVLAVLLLLLASQIALGADLSTPPAASLLHDVHALTAPGIDGRGSGTHYDHLGIVNAAVHPGADDNASGMAVALGLARALAAAGGTPRTVVVTLFSGKEMQQGRERAAQETLDARGGDAE
jgi:hypothetical protein